MAAKRLQRELVMLNKSSPEFIRVAANPDDILTFHWVIGAVAWEIRGGFAAMRVG